MRYVVLGYAIKTEKMRVINATDPNAIKMMTALKDQVSNGVSKDFAMITLSASNS